MDTPRRPAALCYINLLPDSGNSCLTQETVARQGRAYYTLRDVCDMTLPFSLTVVVSIPFCITFIVVTFLPLRLVVEVNIEE